MTGHRGGGVSGGGSGGDTWYYSALISLCLRVANTRATNQVTRVRVETRLMKLIGKLKSRSAYTWSS